MRQRILEAWESNMDQIEPASGQEITSDQEEETESDKAQVDKNSDKD